MGARTAVRVSSVVLGQPVPSTRPHVEMLSVDPGRVGCHLSLEQAQCLIKHEVVLSGAWTASGTLGAAPETLQSKGGIFIQSSRM